MSARETAVLFISNGHGEDAMAALLAKGFAVKVRDAGLAARIAAYPVVGVGDAFRRAGVEVVGHQKAMPSGGFLLERRGNLWADLKAGLLRLTARQWADLRRRRHQTDWAVAVGDVYALFLGAVILGRSTVFLPTAKSESIRGHYAFEYWMMRRLAKLVFPRDAATAEAIRARGANAEYVGNLMMDALDVTGRRFAFSKEGPVVGLLPGTREDAYDNARALLQAAAVLHEEYGILAFLVALAPSLDPEALARAAVEIGWVEAAGDCGDAGAKPDERLLVRGGAELRIVQGAFGDVLAASAIVIGLAGTGNEQAVGMGRPVVAFPGTGSQYTEGFAADQKRLLGEALSLVDPDPRLVAAEVHRILSDPDAYDRMARAGRERMGGPGGADRISDVLIDLIRRGSPPAGPPYKRDA